MNDLRDETDEAERLAAALIAAHDGAYDWNVLTGTVHFSEQWCRMLGYAPEEIAPHYTSWEVRVHPDDLPAAVAALEAHLDARSTGYEIEHRMRRKDGSWAWVLSRGEVVARDGEGRPLRMVGTHKDITALKRAEAAHALFFATMSHELRTPLNAIAGHVQLLEMGIHGPVTAAQTDALKRIDLAQRHLLRLVTEILDLARLEAHGISYDLKAVSLAEVVAELDPLVGPQASAKGVSLTTDVDRACVVRADRDKLVQVLLNLVSNAVKFTDAGGAVTIESVTRAAGGDDPGVVHLRVRDTGIGIPADRLEYIFDPYAQMDTTSAGLAAGTGLGLAISRNLARGMGGDIRARSTPGAGSAFTVTLPRAGD